MLKQVLVFNNGSSSIKFALYNFAGDLLLKVKIKEIFNQPNIEILLGNKIEYTALEIAKKLSYIEILKIIFVWLQENNILNNIIAVGHRVVHGGVEFNHSLLINKKILKSINKLTSLAPLHQPFAVKTIEFCNKILPKIPQVAVFDTSFHASCSLLEKTPAIDSKFVKDGIVNYGFHGISYRSILEELKKYVPDTINRKIMIMHLGNGSSICAIRNNKSVATTMGFSPLQGLIMATRCGDIDPGIILHLQKKYKISQNKISSLLYKESGLFALSQISGNISDLINYTDDKSKFAIDMFCYHAAKKLLSLTVATEGVDVVVFTGGIGENIPIIREKICKYLQWVGLDLDHGLNKINQIKINKQDAKIEILVIRTDEEKIIFEDVRQII